MRCKFVPHLHCCLKNTGGRKLRCSELQRFLAKTVVCFFGFFEVVPAAITQAVKARDGRTPFCGPRKPGNVWCAPGETIKKQDQMEVVEPPPISGRVAGVLAAAPLGAHGAVRSSTSCCSPALRFRRSGPYVFTCLAVGLLALSCAPESFCFEARLPFLSAGLAGSQASADGGHLALRTVKASTRGETRGSQKEAFTTVPMQARRLAADSGSESEDEQGVAKAREVPATSSRTPLPPPPSASMERRFPSTPGGPEPDSSADPGAGSLFPPQLFQSQGSPTGSSSPLPGTSMQEPSGQPGSPPRKPSSPSGHAELSPPLPPEEQGPAVPFGEQPPPQPLPPLSPPPPRVRTGKEINEQVLRELKLMRDSGRETSTTLIPSLTRPREATLRFDRPGPRGTGGPQVRTALDVLRDLTQEKEQLQITAESSSSVTSSPVLEPERRTFPPLLPPYPLAPSMSPIRTGRQIVEQVKAARALQGAEAERHRTEGDPTSPVEGQAPFFGPRPRPQSALQNFRELFATALAQKAAQQVPSRDTSSPASQTHSQPYTPPRPRETSSRVLVLTGKEVPLAAHTVSVIRRTGLSQSTRSPMPHEQPTHPERPGTGTGGRLQSQARTALGVLRLHYQKDGRHQEAPSSSDGQGASQTSSPSLASVDSFRGSQLLQGGCGEKGASTASIESEPGAASKPRPSPESEPPLLPAQHPERARLLSLSASDPGRRSPERGTPGRPGELSRGTAEMGYAGASTAFQSYRGSASLEVPEAFETVEAGPRREPPPFAGMFPLATVAHTAAVGGETSADMPGPDGNLVPYIVLQRVSLSLPPRPTGTPPETRVPLAHQLRRQARSVTSSASHQLLRHSSPAPTPAAPDPFILGPLGPIPIYSVPSLVARTDPMTAFSPPPPAPTPTVPAPSISAPTGHSTPPPVLSPSLFSEGSSPFSLPVLSPSLFTETSSSGSPPDLSPSLLFTPTSSSGSPPDLSPSLLFTPTSSSGSPPVLSPSLLFTPTSSSGSPPVLSPSLFAQTGPSSSPPPLSRSSSQPAARFPTQPPTLPGPSIMMPLAPVRPASPLLRPPFLIQEQPLNLCVHERNVPRLPPAPALGHQQGARAAVSAPGVSPCAGSPPSASPPLQPRPLPPLQRRPPSNERRV